MARKQLGSSPPSNNEDTATKGYVDSGAATLSNKTLIDPRIDESLLDAAGNIILDLWSSPSAVNFVSIANRGAGEQPYIAAGGADANIDIVFNPKGTGLLQLYSDSPTLLADGAGGNKDLNVITSGTGRLKSNGNEVILETGSQTLSNKTIDNSNGITVLDAQFTLQDDVDTTKQLKIQLTNITTGNLRILNAPDANTTIAGTDAPQTLTNKTIVNPTVNNYTEGVVAVGIVTTSHTFDLTNGTVQTVTLTASTACTFTMPTAAAGKSFTVMLKQAASTGNGSATFTGVKWHAGGAPTITTAAGKMDILSFFSDGASWYGSYTQGYTP